MANKFLNFAGLTTLFNKLVEKFTPVLEEVSDVEADTEYYVTNIDYDLIKFDTSEIVANDVIAFDGTVTALYGSFDFGGLVFSDMLYFSIDANILPFNLKSCKVSIDEVDYTLSSTNESASQQSMWLTNSAITGGTPWIVSDVTSSNTYVVLDKSIIEEGSEHQLKITYNPSNLITT